MQAQTDQATRSVWDKRLAKVSFFLLTFIFASLCVFGVQSFYVYVFFIYFPSGLISVFTRNFTDPSTGANILGWLVYLSISTLGVLTKQRKVFVGLYILFVILLLINIAGCALIKQNASLRF
jgi:hypothetical protein